MSERYTHPVCYWGCNACSGLIVAQLCKVELGVTDSFGSRVGSACKFGPIKMQVEQSIVKGLMDALAQKRRWGREMAAIVCVCVCVIWRYVTVPARLACAHEHSVTSQRAQMSHVWLHSRETV